ncbi:ubiquitin carboxyl-terminal hydrolase 23-like isoform X2 [Phoenix dactylifera]|uniref:Ubiquitin carboxyl-terminal hydrolase n=1 Tax=Phoenix dactylifera TaxID=42345 RepID=A0A8B8J6C2_PHODC|nr:ubiquitin carboxyl-terminal hydrolase 23-like isoform X2 [Phoenix dactylifera]
MAEGLAKAKKPEAAAASSPRTIEFHPARKPFSPIARAGGDFHIETLNSSTDSHRPAPSPGARTAAAAGKKISDRGEFYEHGLDPELSFRITFRRIGAGLQNLGNTCFLNSVLQCLTYTEPFAAYLQSGKHKSSCHTTGFCAMCALQNHVMVALQSTGKILSPSHIVKNLRCISRNFRNYRQEDAHEYMVNLLESMHKCCLPSGVPSESPCAYEKSLVHKIFGGRLRSQVKCMQCSYCSNKFDPFLDLSLEIVKADSLRKALAHFTEVEQLDGEGRQYQCQRCKEKVRALKQLTIDKAPCVLTIHLKRFGSHIPGQKINKREGNLKYTLYGVLVHAGWSTHSGHYYCYVRTSSGTWHSLDDNQVRQVSEKTVLAQKAYMLFYVRDRSSLIKRSVDVAHKDNLYANGPVNKLVTRSAVTSNGAAKNSGVERRLSTAECISAKIKSDCNRQSDFVGGTSSDHPLQEVVSSLQNSQNNGQVMPKDALNLLRNGGVISEGLQQTTLPAPKKLPFCKDPKMPVVTSTRDQKLKEDLAQPALLKDNTVTTTYHGSDTSFIHGVQSNDRFHLCNGCNADMKSDILTAEPNDTASPKITEKHAKKLLTENNMMDSKNKPSIFPNQSSPMKQSIQKGVFSEKHVEQQAPGSKNKYSSNIPCQNDEGSLLSEPGLAKLSMKQSTSNGYGQKEAFAETGREHSVAQFYQTDRQLKKLAKCSLRHMYLGRKRLFFASLRLHKSRTGKRSRKHQLSSRNMTQNGVLDNLGISEQTTLTSQAIKAGIHSHRKRSHSSSIKDNNSQGAIDNSYCNGDSAVTDGQIEEGNDKNISMIAASRRVKRCLSSAANECNSRETDANEKGPQQHEFMSMLMRGLKETTVAQWDDFELAKSEARGPENSRNNSIGYVLDKWDEEYDRGKVKKVKKSRQSFNGPNPFQETSNVKAQQKMKVDYIRSGNQPFRI